MSGFLPHALDSRTWSAATWAAPFTVQLLVGALAVVMLLLAKAGCFPTSDRAWFLTATVITAVIAALTSGALVRSSSWRVRGLGLSLGGSAAVILAGGTLVGFVLHT
jgi:hypothetical protein